MMLSGRNLVVTLGALFLLGGLGWLGSQALQAMQGPTPPPPVCTDHFCAEEVKVTYKCEAPVMYTYSGMVCPDTPSVYISSVKLNMADCEESCDACVPMPDLSEMTKATDEFQLVIDPALAAGGVSCTPTSVEFDLATVTQVGTQQIATDLGDVYVRLYRLDQDGSKAYFGVETTANNADLSWGMAEVEKKARYYYTVKETDMSPAYHVVLTHRDDE